MSAFQFDAFQDDAFMADSIAPAFQPGAFQVDAFQTIDGEAPPASGEAPRRGAFLANIGELL